MPPRHPSRPGAAAAEAGAAPAAAPLRVLLLLCAAAAAATAQGAPGPTIDALLASKWLPPGRGYDWSRAGYAGGERPLPNPRGPLFNVVSYGAIAGGRVPADRAFKLAIQAAAAAPGYGIVQVPAGTFLLASPLYINHSRVVLRGAGTAKTKILFSRSLTDIYKGSWSVNPCSGRVTNPWSAGGALIVFSGQNRTSGNVLARVTADSRPGGRRLWVSSIQGVAVGQWLQLQLNDKTTLSPEEDQNCTDAGRRAATGASAAAAANARWGGKLSILPVTAELSRDPIFALAMEAAAEGEGGDETLSLAEAAAIDAKLARGAAAGAQGGQVGIAAAPRGSVAAWTYGDGKADSGGPGAVNPSAMRFVFRVAGRGRQGNAFYIDIDRDLIHLVRRSWISEVTKYKPGIEESGIEHLTVGFVNSGLYQGHFTERGYNAIQIDQAANCWVRSVVVEGADSGIFTRKSDFVTLQDVTITTLRDRSTPNSRKSEGHHAINTGAGQSCLVTRFKMNKRYWHDLTVAQGTTLAVYSRGSGRDINMDHHRGGPIANLFTDVQLGESSRPFQSGGRSVRGAHTGRGATFWNLYPSSKRRGQAIALPDCDFGPYLNFMLPSWSGGTCPRSGWWVGRWARTLPANLYEAQVAERRRRRRSLQG